MKPKEVICPICGEKMFPINWGKKRDLVAINYDGKNFYSDVINYVKYECSCGCVINYEGETDCWKKHECKCKSCERHGN